jgi:ribosomal-protein-alanine N-acetyltransferase
MESDGERIAEKLRILPMSEWDIPTIVDLEKQSFSMPWSPQSFRSILADAFSFSYVGVLEGKIITYAVFGAIEDYAELWNLAVDESHRGKGIGDTMLKFVIEHCRGSDVSSLFLQVRESNGTAKRLYERNGFVFVMVQKDYYRSPLEDALVYRLDIKPTKKWQGRGVPGRSRRSG